MPVRLSITVSKIASLPNTTNAALISEFYQYMKNNGASESHTNNSLKTNMAFAKFLGPNVTFYDIQRKEEIIAFLDTKIKSIEEDPDRKWITTWNDYLNDIKYFFRWLYNSKKKIENEYNEKEQIVSSSASDWERLHLLELRKRRLKTKPLSRDRGDIAPFLKLYRLSKAAGMNVQQVVNLLAIANNDLPDIQRRYERLKREVNTLEFNKQQSHKAIAYFNNQIEMKSKALTSYRISCIRERREIENLAMKRQA